MYNKIFYPILIVVSIFICYSCRNNPVAPISATKIKTINIDTLNEIFPLAKGKSYLYSYDSYMRENTSYKGYRDSGSVQYIVLDSILSDSTVTWTIKETQHLYHTQHKTSVPDFFVSDTTYLIDTTNIFTLKENITGFHELNCRSLVWTFPFVDSIFVYPEWTKTNATTIYRYLPKDNYSFIIDTSYVEYYMEDTVSFSKNLGMTHLGVKYNLYVMSGYSQSTKINLIH